MRRGGGGDDDDDGLGGSSLFHAFPIRILASFFPTRTPFPFPAPVPPPPAREWRALRGLPNQSSGSSRSCCSRARCSIRIRSLLRARLPTLMGALAPQPSPNVSPFSQSRGARVRIGDVASSEKGPERVLYRPKADGTDGVSYGRERSLQSYRVTKTGK